MRRKLKIHYLSNKHFQLVRFCKFVNVNASLSFEYRIFSTETDINESGLGKMYGKMKEIPSKCRVHLSNFKIYNHTHYNTNDKFNTIILINKVN